MKQQYCIDVTTKRPLRVGQIVFIPAVVEAQQPDSTTLTRVRVGTSPGPYTASFNLFTENVYGIVGEVE